MVRTTGRSGLVCWINHAAYGCRPGLRSWRPPEPPFQQRIDDVERNPIRLPRVQWLASLLVCLFGLRESMHAVFAREAPVRPGELRKRPGVLWPRVVTMRYVAGGEHDPAMRWHQIRLFNSPRLIAWRERRATLFEVVRHHGAALYERHGAKLSWRRLLRGHP